MYDSRASGVLLAVSSLPGPYGVGSLGAPARRFVDFLADAGQTYWQILPLVPPGHGNSPYMSPSAFAGNPDLIDLDELVSMGLLTHQEVEAARRDSPDRVDYAHLQATRMDLLYQAFLRFPGLRAQMPEELHLPWLEDYAKFAALHDQYQTDCSQWPKEAVPDPQRMAFHTFLQDIFYQQWFHLKDYANQKGIRIMGDIPIYLSSHSAEFYFHPELFQVDGQGRLTAAAGVPPDAFTAEGQFWGNPLYDWEGHKRQVFLFWKERIHWCSRLYDAIRIDHFRAFHTYWCIPDGAADARGGHWEPGPGMELVEALRSVPGLALIAEDLGDLDADALHFIADSGLPGMKVLVYAFDPAGESAYLPHNCPRDAVIYTGTHDTPTFVQWLFEQAAPAERDYAFDYLRLREDEGFGWGAVCGAWMSPCRLAIAPMQDLLGLGGDARVNTPGTAGPRNWSWRVRQEALNPSVSGRLAHITRTYRR